MGLHSPIAPPTVNVLEMVVELLAKHVALTALQRMTVALWVLHTYVFHRFAITPRLALLSPVRGCGKTTLLELLEWLTLAPYRSDNVTPASLYYELGDKSHTLLLDEADNLGLANNSTLRAVFNAGHRRGGAVSRYVDRQSQKFEVFAPLAIAAIGTLPLPLMQRSVIIQMQRAASDEQRHQLDPHDPTFPEGRDQIGRWAATCQLQTDPPMPPELRNRAADNWRVLLAIADDLGHGEEARAAAIALNAGRGDEDTGVLLLADIRTVFDTRGVDRISSAELVRGLIELDDAQWGEWRGTNDARSPRKLSQTDVAHLLRPFGIRPTSIWPTKRTPSSKSRKGYRRADFTKAWDSYCAAGGTAAQPNDFKGLPLA